MQDKLLLASLTALLSCVAASSVRAQLTWVHRTQPGSPAERLFHAMVFDSQRGKTVLFGGFGTTSNLGDTWEWDGTSWANPTPAGPPARFLHAMAYDSQRGKTVLFGGGANGAPFLGDTWEWDGSTWTQVSTSGPSPRRYHAMAYDSQRGRTVMFGGGGGTSTTSVTFGDTWEWDGIVWTQVATTGPSARIAHAMTYDSQRGRTVMIGGGLAGASVAGTWEWDGASWTQMATAGPLRAGHAMAYDSQRDRTVLYGHNNSFTATEETWEWNGSSWSLAAAVGPPRRYDTAMAYDSQRGKTVLFGGAGFWPDSVYLNETWEWGIGGAMVTATTSTFGTGCGSPPITIAAQAGSRPVLGQSQVSDISGAYQGIALVAWGLSNQFLGTTPLPISLAPAGFTGCTLWHSAEGDLAMGCTATGPSTAQHTFPIPVHPVLVSLHVYLLAWTFAPGYNPIGLATSNAVDLFLGDI